MCMCICVYVIIMIIQLYKYINSSHAVSLPCMHINRILLRELEREMELDSNDYICNWNMN